MKIKRSRHLGERSELVLKKELKSWLRQWNKNFFSDKETQKFYKVHNEVYNDLINKAGKFEADKFYNYCMGRFEITPEQDPRNLQHD